MADRRLSEVEPNGRRAKAASLLYRSQGAQQDRIDIHETALYDCGSYTSVSDFISIILDVQSRYGLIATDIDMKRRVGDDSFAWRITGLFTAVIAATYAFGVYVFPSLIPDMRRDLSLSYAEIGQIAGARQVAFLLTALGSAAAVLRFGAGAVILGSVLLCGMALCGLSMVGSGWMAACLLVVLNACAASAWIPMVSLVSNVVSYQHQGKAIGLIASGTNYGLCLNGILVPLMLAAFGWRSVWLAAGGLTLLLSGVVWRTLIQASLLSTTKFSLIKSTIHWRFAPRHQYSTLFGIAFLGGLVGVPFANYLSTYLRADLKFSAEFAGECWLTMGLAGTFGGVFFGFIGDKAGLRVALALAASLLATAATIVTAGRSAAPLVFAAGCFGASFFSIFGILPAYVGKTSDPDLTPTICGMVECSLGLGGALGSFLGGLSPELLGSFRPLYVGAGLISAVVVVLACYLPPEKAPCASAARTSAQD